MSLFGFANASGWYAFLSIIPLIILYLIRPRPQDMDIPSLMFFIKAKSSDKERNFFRNFVKDWLFWLQLFVLILLSFTLVSPFITVNKDVVSNNVVLVIDASASSQVIENGKSRFETSISEAKNFLGVQNSVITVRGSPVIGVRDKSEREAINYLNSLKPSDTKSKIGDAILLAGDIIEGKGRVIVLSDFINTEGTHPEIAKSILKSKGIAVDYINTIRSEKKNVGIVDIKADEDATRVFIKNFENSGEDVTIKVGGTEKDLFINSGKIETYNFATIPGVTKITLVTRDDFPVDDVAYVSAPDEKAIKILLITNKQSLYLKSALESLRHVEVEVAEPPVIPNGDYDVYVVDHVTASKMLPGTYADLTKKTEEGASLIIAAQSETRSVDYEGAMPVGFKGVASSGTVIPDQASKITKDVEFGGVDSYFETNLEEGAISLAKVGESSIIAFRQRGNGKVAYYGILEDSSNFKLSPSYPIFWSNLIKFMTNQNDITSLNLKTGSVLAFDKPQEVITPNGKITEQTVLLDKIGVYTVGDRQIAANLLSDAESNVNEAETKIGEGIDKFVFTPVKENVQIDLEIWLIIIVIFLLFLEIVLIKLRGDL